MNGEPLPSLHGGPVRLVVPGWVGDDWIKWVTSISVQEEPSDGFYYQKGYRYPDIAVKPGDAVPPESMKPMEELVTRSLFSSPSQGAGVSRSEPVTLKGVGWTGGDKTIEKIEVSDDGGKNWKEARFLGKAEPYAWRQWELSWQPGEAGPIELLCRATDSSGFVQPVEDSPWNPGGYLWRSADRLQLEVQS
jgi:DMSO/TMAO reductase YedYZ molybdopterin-dependent catalytic subunit